MRQVVADNERSGGDSTQVLSLFKRILAEPQKNADMYELYVAYMKLKQMPEDSINSVLEKALEVAPDNAGVRFQLVQSKWMSQDYDTVIAPQITYHFSPCVFKISFMFGKNLCLTKQLHH